MTDFIDLPDPTFCYYLTVPKIGKDWINANQRLFWRVRAARTRQWRGAAEVAARTAGIPRIEHAWIVCEVWLCGNRRRDVHNWMPTAKACVDGLVDAGLFADDNTKHVTGPDMRLGDPVPHRIDEHLRFLIYPTDGFARGARH